MNAQTTQKNLKKNQNKQTNKKIGGHIPYRYPMSTIWKFDNIENKHTLNLEEDCMKIFFSSLRVHATNVIKIIIT